MPFFVVQHTWTAPHELGDPPHETRLVAGCPTVEQARGLADAHTAPYLLRGVDPDTGHWWACASGALHEVLVTGRPPV